MQAAAKNLSSKPATTGSRAQHHMSIFDLNGDGKVDAEDFRIAAERAHLAVEKRTALPSGSGPRRPAAPTARRHAAQAARRSGVRTSERGAPGGSRRAGGAAWSHRVDGPGHRRARRAREREVGAAKGGRAPVRARLEHAPPRRAPPLPARRRRRILSFGDGPAGPGDWGRGKPPSGSGGAPGCVGAA